MDPHINHQQKKQFWIRINLPLTYGSVMGFSWFLVASVSFWDDRLMWIVTSYLMGKQRLNPQGNQVLLGSLWDGLWHWLLAILLVDCSDCSIPFVSAKNKPIRHNSQPSTLNGHFSIIFWWHSRTHVQPIVKTGEGLMFWHGVDSNMDILDILRYVKHQCPCREIMAMARMTPRIGSMILDIQPFPCHVCLPKGLPNSQFLSVNHSEKNPIKPPLLYMNMFTKSEAKFNRSPWKS